MTASHELESIVGDELMQEICKRFGGLEIYIPHALPGRGPAIVQSFETVLPHAPTVGSAYETVAERFNCSPRTVRRLVAQA